MLTRPDLERLYGLADGPVLSVYLHTDPSQDPKASHRIWLKDALKDRESELDPPNRKPFREAADRVQRHLANRRPESTSWVAFVGDDVFEAFALNVPVENEVQWGRPELTQMEWLREEYRPYGVALVDSTAMRFFVVAMNELTELGERALTLDTDDWREKSMMPPSQARGSPTRGSVKGGSQREQFDDRMDAQIKRFWREAGPVLDELATQYEATEIVLGGSKDVRERFRATLDEAHTRRVIGQISLRIDAAETEILAESLEIIQAHERAREADRVAELLQRASTSRQGGVGLAATLKTIQEGRASQVVVNRRLDADVWECSDCAYVTTPDADVCPQCGANALQEGSLRALLPVLLRRFGTDLEIVRGEAADELEPHGGIGAFWRY